MYLHLMRDDKFIDEFVGLVRKYFDPGEHKFVAICPGEPKYLKSGVAYASYPSDEFDTLLGDLSDYSKIFIHFLDYKKSHFLIEREFDAEVYWLFWGADYYERADCVIHDKNTLKFLKNNDLLPEEFPKSILRRHKFDLYYRSRTGKKLKNLISDDEKKRVKQYQKKIDVWRGGRERIDYFCHFIKEDYEIIRRDWNLTAEFKDFFYLNRINFDSLGGAPNHDFINRYIKIPKEAPRILVGNSGTPANNHLGVIRTLKKIKKDFVAIFPVSYGDERYIEKLIPVARRELGERFLPLTEFLPADIFAEIIKSVDLAVMNHRRPQGLGNIIALLFAGKKIAMNPKSTATKFLLERGIRLSGVGDVRRIVENLNFELTEGSKLMNSTIVQELFSEEKAVQNLKKLFEE